jgi:hypothetical protein
MEAWAEWEAEGWADVYTEAGRCYMGRIHELRLAIYDTMALIEGHKNRRRVWTRR